MAAALVASASQSSKVNDMRDLSHREMKSVAISSRTMDRLRRHVFVLPPCLHVADQSSELGLALGVDISEPMLARVITP